MVVIGLRTHFGQLVAVADWEGVGLVVPDSEDEAMHSMTPRKLYPLYVLASSVGYNYVQPIPRS